MKTGYFLLEDGNKIEFELYPEAAPGTVANFEKLALLDGIEKGIDTITDAEIKNVTEGANYSTESIGHIKQSVKIFAELLHEGTQFHPSLDAPSETVEAFPEPQKNLEEPQQLLETLADNLPEQE